MTAATDRSWLGKAPHSSTFFSSSSFSTLCEIWDMLSSVNISSSTSSRKRSKSSINSSSIEFSITKENFAMSSETFFRFLHTFVLCCCRTESPLSSIEERLPFLSSNEPSEYLTRTSASFQWFSLFSVIFCFSPVWKMFFNPSIVLSSFWTKDELSGVVFISLQARVCPISIHLGLSL